MATKKPAKKTSAKKSRKVAAKKTPATGKEKPAKKKLTKKEKIRRRIHIALGVFAFIIFLIWLGLQPLRAGINYGICRSYIETMIQYPKSYKITEYYEIKRENNIIQKGDHRETVKIFFTHTDAYGGTRAEMVECKGGPDPVLGYKMTEIIVNRASIKKDELLKFNNTIPGIIATNPDLVIPRPPKTDDLSELKRDD